VSVLRSMQEARRLREGTTRATPLINTIQRNLVDLNHYTASGSAKDAVFTTDSVGTSVML
jgi:hypothetical protein